MGEGRRLPGRGGLIIPHDVKFDLNIPCPLNPVAKINDFLPRYPVSSDLNITNPIIIFPKISRIPLILYLNPIQTGLFWSICDWGGGLLGPPSVSLETIMLGS